VEEIDFDAWCDLAQRRPEQYFRERERVIEGFIRRHPPEQAKRLRALQSEIDRARAESGSPLRATRLMLAMMEDQLDALRLRLISLQSETEALALVLSRARGAG